tara:strand:- start:52 stop:252 length:201 start_codon:yes stop_codon:yes gene_type:complete
VGVALPPNAVKKLGLIRAFAWDHVKKDDTFQCTLEMEDGQILHMPDYCLFSLEDVRKEYERIYGEF